MHILIMGCGRTGSALATEFEARGHSVAIIDQAADAFRRLPAGFQGKKITGVGFDRDTLMAAGVNEAYGFAAVSDGDNSNVLAARVVRETYGVENVVARISDEGRADVYQRLGISTVAPVPWTSAQILSRLLPAASSEAYSDPSADILMRRVKIADGWVGRPYADVEEAVSGRIAYVVRFNDGVVPDPHLLVQEGDEPFLVTSTANASKAEKLLAKAPVGDSSTRGKPAATRKAAKK